MKIVYTFFIKLPLIALVAHASRLRSLAAPACARAPGSGCASRSRPGISAATSRRGRRWALSRALSAFPMRHLAEPVEDLHDQCELLLEVPVELVGVAHGEEPLRQPLRRIAESESAPVPLTSRFPFRHDGRNGGKRGGPWAIHPPSTRRNFRTTASFAAFRIVRDDAASGW